MTRFSVEFLGCKVSQTDGDDYSPWLLDAPVGELVRVRAREATPEGILAA